MAADCQYRQTNEVDLTLSVIAVGLGVCLCNIIYAKLQEELLSSRYQPIDFKPRNIHHEDNTFIIHPFTPSTLPQFEVKRENIQYLDSDSDEDDDSDNEDNELTQKQTTSCCHRYCFSTPPPLRINSDSKTEPFIYSPGVS